MGEIDSAAWFKSSRSANNCQCVEVAMLPTGHVGVRDSKNPDGPALIFTSAEWEAFIAGVKDGEFDLPHQAAPVAR